VDASAIVLVDGEVRGAAGVGRPLAVTGLPRGSRRIEVRAAGHETTISIVELIDATPVAVRIHLEPTPERVESQLRLTPEDRRRIRAQLGQLGYPSDASQDLFDSGFRQMLRQFQQQSGLPPTGYLTAETRTLLGGRTIEPRRPPRAPEPPRLPADGPAPLPGGRYLQFPEPAPNERWMDPDVP